MKTLVVAPHPDDETLGVGGTLLRRKAEGGETAWLIVTGISEAGGWPEARVAARKGEIAKVSKLYGFDRVYELGFPAAKLDAVPVGELVGKISEVLKDFCPDEIFLPHEGDVHTDHRNVFDAVVSCTKWFRYPFVKRVLAYETLSETGFGLGTGKEFQPNVFVDVSKHLEQKLQVMEVYGSEMGEFPFPRSREAILALAQYRGSTSGFRAAEAFELLRERG